MGVPQTSTKYMRFMRHRHCSVGNTLVGCTHRGSCTFYWAQVIDTILGFCSCQWAVSNNNEPRTRKKRMYVINVSIHTTAVHDIWWGTLQCLVDGLCLRFCNFALSNCRRPCASGQGAAHRWVGRQQADSGAACFFNRISEVDDGCPIVQAKWFVLGMSNSQYGQQWSTKANGALWWTYVVQIDMSAAAPRELVGLWVCDCFL